MNKFGMACEGFTDDGDEVCLLLNGKATVGKSGKVVLRKTQGIGFTDSMLLKLVFAADQQ